MTADTEVQKQVSEVSKAEIEEKCSLDMSSYQDLNDVSVGANSHGISRLTDCQNDDHPRGNVNGRVKDDPDNSYVFVGEFDVTTDDPILHTDINVNANPECKLVEVKIGEFKLGNGELVKSSAEDNGRLTQVSAQNQPFHNWISPEGKANSNEVEITPVIDALEEQSGKQCRVDGDLQQLPIQLDSSSQPRENKESQVVALELGSNLGENAASKNLSSDNDYSMDVNETMENDTEVDKEMGVSQASQNLSLVEAPEVKNSTDSMGLSGENLDSQNVNMEATEYKSQEAGVTEMNPKMENSLKLLSDGQESQNVTLQSSKHSQRDFGAGAASGMQIEVVEMDPQDQCQVKPPQEESLFGLSPVPTTVTVDADPCQLVLEREKVGTETNKNLGSEVNANHESDVEPNGNLHVSLGQTLEEENLMNEISSALRTKDAHYLISEEREENELLCHVRDNNVATQEPNVCIDEESLEMCGSTEEVESSASANCVDLETATVFKSVETGERSLAGSGDLTPAETFAAHTAEIKQDTDTENFDARNVENAIPSSLNDSKSEILISDVIIENKSVDSDKVSCSQAITLSPITEVIVQSLDSEGKVLALHCEDLHNDTEVAKMDSRFANGQSVSVDAKSEAELGNSSVLSRKDGSCGDPVAPATEVLNRPSHEAEFPCVNVENIGNPCIGEDVGTDNEIACQESKNSDHTSGISASSPDGAGSNARPKQDVGTDVMMRPFYFLVRMPRFDDEKLRENIKNAQYEVDEETKRRDVIRLEIQKKRAICQQHSSDYGTAKAAERDARKLVRSKRTEIESVQTKLNRVKNTISVDNINGRMYEMEHRIQHETLPLSEEKELIHRIKQLKQIREQLSSGIGNQDVKVHEALEQQVQIEEDLKVLKKELDILKDNALKAEKTALAASKKYEDEHEKLKELQSQFKAADDIRQAAYRNLLSLKRELFDKNKHFRRYKDDAAAASDFASKRDRNSVCNLCINQVENYIELWNKDEHFRSEYIRCNTRSTLRRLGTLDGRSLGPDEEAHILPNRMEEKIDRPVLRATKASYSAQENRLENDKESTPIENDVADNKLKMTESKREVVKIKAHAKPVQEKSPAMAPGRDVSNDIKDDTDEQTKEEVELERRQEEQRKLEFEERLKEQRRLEEKAKAKEALERKKRNAEKAQMRAELRAQKEAEQKEKEREKRLRKKEKKKTAGSESHNENDGEIASVSDSIPEAVKVPEIKDSAPAVTRRPQKSSQFTKQSKTRSIPPPLRNRSRRRMQQWMWVIFTSLFVIALFLLGNIGFFSTLKRRHSAL